MSRDRTPYRVYVWDSGRPSPVPDTRLPTSLPYPRDPSHPLPLQMSGTFLFLCLHPRNRPRDLERVLRTQGKRILRLGTKSPTRPTLPYLHQSRLRTEQISRFLHSSDSRGEDRLVTGTGLPKQEPKRRTSKGSVGLVVRTPGSPTGGPGEGEDKEQGRLGEGRRPR